MKKLSKRAVNRTKQLTVSAVFTALVIVATIIIAIPAPAGGFLNVGDTAIFITAACLGPIPGLIAGGLGSCIADLIAGFGAYAPFTLVIKGLEGLICGLLIKLFEKLISKKKRGYALHVALGVAAMTVSALEMSGLYCLADGLLYGWGATVANAPMNLLQGAIGIAAGSIIVYSFNLPKYAKRFGFALDFGDWKRGGNGDAADIEAATIESTSDGGGNAENLADSGAVNKDNGNAEKAESLNKNNIELTEDISGGGAAAEEPKGKNLIDDSTEGDGDKIEK